MRIAQRDKRAFKIIICEIRNEKIIFEGLADLYYLGKDVFPFAVTETGEKYQLEMKPFPAVERDTPEEQVYVSPYSFYVEIPIRPGLEVSFALEEGDGNRYMLLPGLGKFTGAVNNIRGSYFHRQGWLVQYNKGVFSFARYSRGKHLSCEARYLISLWKKKHSAVVLLRILCYINSLFCRKPIWLVCDRTYVAGDNGEHLFRYLQGTDAVKDNRVYFVIRKDSPDYPRIRKIGPVLAYGSLRHKIKYMQSRVILGSTYNELMTNIFGKTGIYYRDLRRFDFVFLRHGVAYSDQSRWINKLRLNIRMLVSTSRPEYEAILKGNYGYTEREVKLTGLPRFDNLYDERKKQIAILPTWRRQLQGEIDSQTLQRKYAPEFRESDYFLFYNSLIHDERLLEAMERMGYTGVFYLHPVFEQQYRDFTDSSRITIGEGTAEYQKVFRESSILVTDYSSVGFDFAYMKKPLIYSQFDRDTFYQEHSYGKGYFDHAKVGFGPVTKTIEQTVDELIFYMENDCQMKPLYLDRVDNFFAFTDRGNCCRVYEEICRILG